MEKPKWKQRCGKNHICDFRFFVASKMEKKLFFFKYNSKTFFGYILGPIFYRSSNEKNVLGSPARVRNRELSIFRIMRTIIVIFDEYSTFRNTRGGVSISGR